jgi:membrane protein YdbS with pleckstrin-like domain
MSARFILQSDKAPFPDVHTARQIAEILSAETGRYYRAVSYEDGFAIRQDGPGSYYTGKSSLTDSFPEIYLRPAWRSQLSGLLTCLIIVIALLGIEPLLLLLKLDVFRVMFYKTLGIIIEWQVIINAAKLFLVLVLGFLVSKILAGKYGQRFYIGPNGIESSIGIISRNQTRIEFKHIRGVNLRQGIFERLLNVGDIVISTSSDQDEVKLDDIARPGDVLSELRRRLRALA